jgi:predicted MFS family arabinose efflux permease
MFLNAAYNGIGRSTGAILGGKVQAEIGTVQTFLYSAITDFCFAAIAIVYLRLRKSSNFRNPTPLLPSIPFYEAEDVKEKAQ